MIEIKQYESLEEALMFCIRASNKEIKEVAAALWPSDRIETSYPRLVDALNPAKRQKLTMDEIIFIMQFCNRYDPLYYMADRCCFERPNQISIEAQQKDMAVKLEEMIDKAQKAYQQIIRMTKARDEGENIRKGTVSFVDFERKSG